jgi:hypothetical protein
MTKNRFEIVDEPQSDAITLALWKADGESLGSVTCPAALTGGQFASDITAGPGSAKEAFRHAIKIANEFRAPIVVMDPDGVWNAEWGELYHPV